MFSEIITCMNARQSAALRVFTAIRLITGNFFPTANIKTRGNVGGWVGDVR